MFKPGDIVTPTVTAYRDIPLLGVLVLKLKEQYTVNWCNWWVCEVTKTDLTGIDPLDIVAAPKEGDLVNLHIDHFRSLNVSEYCNYITHIKPKELFRLQTNQYLEDILVLSQGKGINA